jgi:signal transduction histidine kinase
VLRNSLRFLPRLAAELGAPSPLELTPPSQRSALWVVQDALLLAQRPEHGVAERLGLGLARLEHERLIAPAADRSALESLLVHARIVQERSLRLHALTSALIDPGAARRARRANDVFAAELRDQAQRAEADGLRLLLAGLTSAALVAASIILRLRRSAAALQETGRQLSQAVQSLRAEQAKQRELSELKSRFVAMTSHEFRTPLSVIMSSAELLEAYAARWPASKNAEHFARLRGAALGMTRMLDSILLIGKSDAGALCCDAGALEVGAFCADVVSYMAQADPDCRRIVYQGPDHPTTVYADRALLRQVLENLLSNAVKYSPDGTPVLCEVACRQRELQLRVVDRGIGISRADQRHLFETFQRGSNVGNIRGTGLGLAVVGRAVQLHGGVVSVHSDLGMGSEFLVRIPCREDGAWAEYS